MEFGSIERRLHIEAPPEVVFEVVSRPEHLREWWPDDARFEPVAGSAGEIVFGDCDAGGVTVGFTVVDVVPPHSFSFRWTQRPGEVADERNSLLVTFQLSAADGGTLLTMTETGFRERGWEVAVLEQQYREHVAGWDQFLPRLAPYVATLAARR